MTEYTITETIGFVVKGDSAQDALDAWLNEGEGAEGYAFCEVSEREVFDAQGQPCEVEEP